MEQFSLDKWLENKSRKVVTRDGREVDIYYSPTSRVPLIGRTSDNKVHQYTEDGFQYDIINEAKNDIFFADEELTEFEKALLAAFNCVAGKAVTTIGTASFQEDVDEWSKPLLDLARKEILKDLPRWYQCHDESIYDTVPDIILNPLRNHKLINNGYIISISELFEKLPKEE